MLENTEGAIKNWTI